MLDGHEYEVNLYSYQAGNNSIGFRIISYYSSFENPDSDFDRFFNRKSLVLILLIPAEIYFIPCPLYFIFVFLHLPNLLPTEAKVKGRGIIWQLSSVQCQSRHSYVLSVLVNTSCLSPVSETQFPVWENSSDGKSVFYCVFSRVWVFLPGGWLASAWLSLCDRLQPVLGITYIPILH